MVLGSVSAFAGELPLLEKTLGGLDTDGGVVHTTKCSIYKSYDEIDTDKVLELIKEAEKEEFDKFVHVKQQIPSVEIYAYYKEKFAVGPAATGLRTQKVLLFKDSSQGEQRQGKAAAKLIELLEEACKPKGDKKDEEVKKEDKK
jgi:hypothetical protein